MGGGKEGYGGGEGECGDGEGVGLKRLAV